MKKRRRKKSTKHSIDWRQTLVGAIVDLVIGIILLIISQMIE